MKKLILSIIALISICNIAFSQNASDALRYSRIFYNGTARFQGMGGAFGAVGADFSVIATNPAGLGLYRSSEISFSPSLSINHTSTDYYGTLGSDTRGNFAFGNIGMVIHIQPHKKHAGGFQDFNFAIGVNRQNDFNRNYYMQGTNNTSSMMTDWVNILNNQFLTPQDINDQYQFDISLATNSNAIYLYDTLNRLYANDAPHGGVLQKKWVTTRGSINEFDLSFGGNLDDQLYFGATIGIPVIRYFENSRYQEFKNDPSIPYFQSLTYNQLLETHGTGFNLKAGIIYRPANWIKIGASIHTPTYYSNMRDSYSSDMTTNVKFDSIIGNTQYSPLGYFNYQMITPFRAMGSLAFFFGKVGLVSAEYEFVNYDQARFYSSELEGFNTVNSNIKSNYTIPLNLRFGTEWKIEEFGIRGGFEYNGSPYNYSGNIGERYSINGGLGYRGKEFFADIVYGWTQMKEEYYFYDSNIVKPSYNTLTSNIITATIGLKF